MDTCYGCGATLYSLQYYLGRADGELIRLCPYRSTEYSPKLSCLGKAQRKLWEARWCPACGRTGMRWGQEVTICKECAAALRKGYKSGHLREEIEEQVVESAINILSAHHIDTFSNIREGILVRDQKQTLAEAAKLTETLRARFYEVLQQEHARGVMEGTQLLQRLSTGEISISHFNDALTRSRRKVRSAYQESRDVVKS